MAKTTHEHPEEATERRRAKASKKVARTTRPPEVAASDQELNFIQFIVAGSSGGAKANTVEVDAKPPSEAGKRGRAATGKALEEAHEKQEEAPKTPTAPSPPLRIPDSVQERFIQIGNRFHFPDGTEAFTHHGNRLTTRSENAIVIQSMVAIAREETHGAITVGGTEFFKKEAWFAASLVGLKVSGYEPTEFERERLARAIAARRGPPSSETKPAPEAGREAARSTDGHAEGRAAQSALIVGKLVDHGPAHYAHNPKEPMSYFVRIETERGDRDIWGVDLERAFRHSLSTPGIGDDIGLRAMGKEAVTVLTSKRDAEGREVGREALDTHRNQWIVERKAFLDQRLKMAEVLRDASVSASEATKRHPELEGSYLQLQMGRALAEQQYSSQEHREQFVDHLRSHLAQRIEFGQPLEPVHLRASEARSPEPPSAERDYSPTR